MTFGLLMCITNWATRTHMAKQHTNVNPWYQWKSSPHPSLHIHNQGSSIQQVWNTVQHNPMHTTSTIQKDSLYVPQSFGFQIRNRVPLKWLESDSCNHLRPGQHQPDTFLSKHSRQDCIHPTQHLVLVLQSSIAVL